MDYTSEVYAKTSSPVLHQPSSQLTT
ncbi:hypothetical protein DERP_000493 [Dermatophagoides pteronyssinus]|uniref:Uncharacterized protein n=1 Tax=Dermatophagoides pteronyssinus TaxID=6956 RepID=A0ABQ8J0D5_DERPT|nr:hypothetical protein DERP_000493 [Dermatophagoides pteronyssinus]